MKNVLRRGLVVLVSLSPLLGASGARGTVTWTATFEKNKTGDLCSSSAVDAEFKLGVNETKGTRKNAEVLGEKVYAGNLACKVTVHPDDTYTYNQNRVDIQHPSTLTDEGKDSYLSGHYMMPEDAKVRNEIGFYETNKSFANAMDLWVAPKVGAAGGTTINFAIGFLPDNASWTADFKAGVWHQVAIRVHWSQTATIGYVDLWLDGVKTVTMLRGKTKPNADTLFYQTGLHRRLTYPLTDVIYLDDFVEADTEAEAKIGAPVQGGGQDGAAGSGGAVADGGAAGNQAATGAGGHGSTGSSGATGAAGANATGAAGTTSATGAAGTMGAAGTGAAGTVGAAGTTGVAGTTGAGGPTVTPPRDTPGGCACAASGRGRPGGRGALVLVALVAMRRRGRASITSRRRAG